MASFGVISDVSATIIDALSTSLAKLPSSPKAELHNLQGSIPTAPPKLVVCLYEVNEDATSRNLPMQRIPQPAGLRLAKPPMALTLKYLMAPFAAKAEDEQRILGRVLQSFYEDAIFSGPDFPDTLEAAPAGLVGSTDILAVSLDPLTLEERSRIFHAMQQPYRISLSYQVRVANVHPEQDRRVELVRSRNYDPAIPVEA